MEAISLDKFELAGFYLLTFYFHVNSLLKPMVWDKLYIFLLQLWGQWSFFTNLVQGNVMFYPFGHRKDYLENLHEMRSLPFVCSYDNHSKKVNYCSYYLKPTPRKVFWTVAD